MMSEGRPNIPPAGDDPQSRSDRATHERLRACVIKSGSVFIVLCVLIAIGKYLALQLGFADLDRLAHLALPYVLLVFVLAAAIPFVPGAEIGFGLLMVFGANVAVHVYLSMLVALMLAFLSGRIVRPASSARHLQFLEARVRLMRIRAQNKALCKHMVFIAAVLRLLVRNKHLALCAALNTPGNTILGGGGGLAFLAGASRSFSVLGFAVTASVAVMPIPLLFLALG